MAGPRLPSGSLRNHASSASKAPKGGVFSSQPSAPKVKPGTFVDNSSDSDSDSSSSSSDSDDSDSDKKTTRQTPLPKKKADVARATPAKSPTINGIKVPDKKEQTSKNNKNEATSSSSASSESSSDSGSDSDSASSSDEKPTNARATGEELKKSTKPEPAAADDSQSSSASEDDSGSDSVDEKAKAKKATVKTDKKQATPSKPKAKAARQDTPSESESDSQSSSQASSAESESESGDESEDPEAQIQQQIKDDVKSAKAKKGRGSASTPQVETSNKKVKVSKPSVLKDADGDIEMMDQSNALTNGGAPTKVGSVPEFVAPDFHLRKLDGSINASDVAGFFENAQMEGKQVWYITAPASLPVTVVQDLTIPMDQAQKGLPVLTHNGDDYRLAFDDPSASSSFRLLIPHKKGQEYSELGRPVNQTMHFTRSETFPPEGPASVTTTQTVSKTTRPARPQPEGLRARYTPLGVPASKKPLTPIAGSQKNKSVANVAAQEAAAISTPKSSSKKKRKHDGENGPAATPANKDSSKSASAEKSAKKQKTNRDRERTVDGQASGKETPVPLPTHFSANSSSSPRAGTAAPSATQPAPVVKRSASPGVRLPSTQLPAKESPIPIPFPAKLSSAVSPLGTMARDGKEKKDRKKGKANLLSADMDAARFSEVAAARSPEKSEKSPEKRARTPKKNTPIPPPRHDGRGKFS
ncbi:hypothetical protein Daus18300_003799 [Diaporthe australafricana]|uniref:DNA-directed RNA polymerase I subunit n=1 Tax=Diaporthe australafricana TaxID=127596 RepID=A0ABR3XE26_9PEZI